MRELAAHLRIIPESKATLSEKKLYEFLVQTLQQFQARVKAHKEAKQLSRSS